MLNKETRRLRILQLTLLHGIITIILHRIFVILKEATGSFAIPKILPFMHIVSKFKIKINNLKFSASFLRYYIRVFLQYTNPISYSHTHL